MRGLEISLPETAQGVDIYSKAAGQYALRVFEAGGAYVFRVTATTGDVDSVGTFTTSSGVRLLAYGAYLGVQAANRLVFPNGFVDIYGTNSKTVSISDFLMELTRDNGQTLQ